MNIRQYTTPTIVLSIDGIDLSESSVYVTFKQGDTVLTYTPTVTYEDETSTIEIHMSQEESGQFQLEEVVQVQVNWVHGGERNATNIEYIRLYRNLIEEVI